MISPIPKKSRTVDTLVVGAGLAGLLAAALRAQVGKSVLVVEASPVVGGRWSPERREGFQLGAGIGFADIGAWQRAYEAAGMEFPAIEVDNGRAVVSGNKGWQEPEDLPTWENYFAQTIAAVPRGGFAGFVESVLRQERFEVLHEAPVTELYLEGGRASHATIGNELNIQFSECFWAADAKTLIEVLRGPDAPEAGTARIAWMKQFMLHAPSPGVVLEFAHSQRLSDFTETLILPMPLSEGEEERRYVIGAFLSNRDASLAPEGMQVSSWIFQLPEGIAEDNHEIMKRIRSARRTIEKSFPGFEKSLRFERVQVLPHTVTPVRKRKKTSSPIFPGLVAAADWSSPEGAHFEGVVDNLLDPSPALPQT